MFGFIAFLAVFIVLAAILSGMNSPAAPDRIEYPSLLDLIEKKDVARVAIDGTILYGLYSSSGPNAAAFPSTYDFKCTIGDDFIDTVRTIVAKKEGADPSTVSVKDFGFKLQYVAPTVTPGISRSSPT